MFFMWFILFIELAICVDLDPDVTLNRKTDPSLENEVQSLPTFRAIFDGTNTQIWNLSNGSHWTLPGEHMTDAELDPYRPPKKP